VVMVAVLSAIFLYCKKLLTNVADANKYSLCDYGHGSRCSHSDEL